MLRHSSYSPDFRQLLHLPALAFVLLCLTPHIYGFQFYLHGGEKRCFTETAPPNTKILGEYTVSTGKGHMPVDITVSMAGHRPSLYTQTNVDHGKFAFVVPFEGGDVPKIQKAMLHRKMRAHARKVHERNGRVHSAHHENPPHHARRRLLSVDEHAHTHDDSHGDRYHNERPHEDHDDHKHEGHDEQHHHDYHDEHKNDYHEEYKHDDHRRDDYNHDDHHRDDYHHDDHHDDHEVHHAEHIHEGDDDEYDYDDDMDDFDDDYDGIHDDELEEEEEKMMRMDVEKHGRMEDASDKEKEDRLFDLKKFEICVSSSNGASKDFKRRVRLLVHKGATAHDYTRLAKNEHMSQLEVSLRQVSGELNELMNELDQARRMEDILRQLNENTNKRVVIFSVLSLISLFAVGGYQALYTKRFFKRKKIL